MGGANGVVAMPGGGINPLKPGYVKPKLDL